MHMKLRYKLIIHAILILLCLSFIVPLIYVISLSLTPEDVIKSGGYQMFPKEASLDAYNLIFKNPTQLINSYKITIAFSVVATFLTVLVSAMIAYSLSREQFLYRKGLTFFVYFTMLFSGGLMPSYIINTQYLHLYNSFWVYVLPGLAPAYYILIMRTFFKNLPDSLTEAAKIDGASELKIFTVIVLPLSKPVLATVSLLILLAKWNDWNTSMLYISDNTKISLQYLLQKILREAQFLQEMSNSEGAVASITAQLQKNAPVEGMRFAMAILAAGPMMVIFPFFQKYFTKGLTIGAVKG